MHPFSSHFFFFLVVKLLAGVIVGGLYHYYYEGGDTIGFYKDSLRLVNLCYESPLEGIQVLIGRKCETLSLIYQDQPRALFFVRLITLPLMIAHGSYWGLSLLLSFISFVVIWWFSQVINKVFRYRSMALVVSLFYFPEVLFWTSGVIKECVSFIFLLLFIGGVLQLLYKQSSYFTIAFTLISWYGLFLLKFYVAGLLLAFMIAYAISFHSKRRIVVFISALLISLFGASYLHPQLSLEVISDSVQQNMESTVAISEKGKYIVLNQMDGSISGIIYSVPKALLSSMLRPFIWEANSLLAIGLSLLKMLIAVLLLNSFFHIKRLSFEGVCIVIYSVILASLLALSSPNYGTLSRYNVAFLPFFMLLLFQAWFYTWQQWLGRKQ